MHDGSRILLRPAGANTRQEFYAPVRLHVCLFFKETVKRNLLCVWHLCYVICLVSPGTYFALSKEIFFTYFVLGVAHPLHTLLSVWHIPYIFFVVCVVLKSIILIKYLNSHIQISGIFLTCTNN